MHVYVYWMIAAYDRLQKVQQAQLTVLKTLAPWNPVAAFWATALSPAEEQKKATTDTTIPATPMKETTVASILFPGS